MHQSLCSSKKSRLQPTGFVSRISCCSESCEWSHKLQHFLSEIGCQGDRGLILGNSCITSKGHASWLLHREEFVGNSTQYGVNSELLRICSLPRGFLAEGDNPLCSKIWINMDKIRIVAKFGTNYICSAHTTFHNRAIGPMPFPC